MIPYTWLENAAVRIAPYINKTPLTYDPYNDLYLKWENHQVTGSFKARGAINKVLSLHDWEREAGLVAASAGNHGQGVALAGKLTNSPVLIFASEHAMPSKVEAMKALGADVRLVQGSYGEAEAAGIAYAASSGATWVSPYNDEEVIAGQGTLALEILSQLPPLPQTTWVVPVGGGGLISGISCAIKGRFDIDGDTDFNTTPLGNSAHLVAVQSQASPFFHAIFHNGTQDEVVELPSLADGLAGTLESNSITIPIVRRYVDDFILVSEDDIKAAIFYVWKRYGERIEGSSATSLAAILSGKITNRPAILILSGGNIQPEVHLGIIQSDE